MLVRFFLTVLQIFLKRFSYNNFSYAMFINLTKFQLSIIKLANKYCLIDELAVFKVEIGTDRGNK